MSDVGIYLVQSPIHKRNVALVMIQETELVSPQFHVHFDPYSCTVNDLVTAS